MVGSNRALRPAALPLLLLLLPACGGQGSPQYQGEPSAAEAAFGQCAFCHDQLAIHMTDGGTDLKCQVCHVDLLPGQVGSGHRGIPGSDLVPSFVGPSHAAGAEAVFASCAFCHNQLAMNMTISGVDDLLCDVCHDDRTPGVYGPGHRAIAGADHVPSFADPSHALGAQTGFGSCAYCHNELAVNITESGVADLDCAVCHDERTPGSYGPGHQSIPGTDLVPSFAGPAHSLGELAPFGSCAFCHNQLAVNITASGADLRCELCHEEALSPDFGPEHRSLPGRQLVPSFPGPAHLLGAEARFGDCGFCHNAVAVKAAASPGHGSFGLDCGNCHSDLQPGEVGPNHQSIPRCSDCHTRQRTHQDPAAGTNGECAVCHNPHGSSNIFLIDEIIRTPSGSRQPIEFNNLLGLADGSFASVSRPGSGLCEVCHTDTRYFRSDGAGETHFPFACFTCHPHAGGFAPN